MMHRRAELPVEHDRVHVDRIEAFADRVELASADEGAAVRTVPPLDDRLNNFMPCGSEQRRDLIDLGGQGHQDDAHHPPHAGPVP